MNNQLGFLDYTDDPVLLTSKKDDMQEQIDVVAVTALNSVKSYQTPICSLNTAPIKNLDFFATWVGSITTDFGAMEDVDSRLQKSSSTFDSLQNAWNSSAVSS